MGMSDREREDLFNSLFPVGEERWIKLKYLDRDKCIAKFRVGNHTEQSVAHAKELGYEVIAIGVRPEYEPQVSALMDVRDKVVGMVLDMVDNSGDYRLMEIRQIFKDKIEEINERTIKTVPIENI